MVSRITAGVGAYLDWIVTIALAVVISLLSLDQSISAQTVSNATLLVLGAFAIGSIRDRVAARRLRKTLDELPSSVRFAIHDNELVGDAKETGLSRVLPQTVNHNWLQDMASAHSVSIAKLKLNFTEDPEYFMAFERVLARGGEVSLVLSDPRSPAMWLRYLEEPRRKDRHVASETAWVMGLEELAAEVARLNAWRRKVVGARGRLYIGLFPHYPTHAFYKFDDRLYVFHYPYMARGFHAPAYLFSEPHTGVHAFLTRCHDAVRNASTELTDAVAADVAARQDSGALSDATVEKSQIRIVRKRRR